MTLYGDDKNVGGGGWKVEKTFRVTSGNEPNHDEFFTTTTLASAAT